MSVMPDASEKRPWDTHRYDTASTLRLCVCSPIYCSALRTECLPVMGTVSDVLPRGARLMRGRPTAHPRRTIYRTQCAPRVFVANSAACDMCALFATPTRKLS